MCATLRVDKRGRVQGEKWHRDMLPAFLTHLFLQSEISMVRQLRWRLGLSAGLTVYIVMGNLVDKEAVSLINRDLRVPSPPSATRSLSRKASRKPTSAAQIRPADSSSTLHNQEVSIVTCAAVET